MRLRLIAVAVLVSACQLAPPIKAPEPPVAKPITSGQISVTALESPSAAEEPAETKGPAVAQQPPVASDPVAEHAPLAASAPPKSASQTVCEKRKGAWVSAGTTGTMSCQTPQRDGGKQCNRDSDCEGQCLARSRSCAPVAPLFGCNEILQDNGQRVTLCIE